METKGSNGPVYIQWPPNWIYLYNLIQYYSAIKSTFIIFIFVDTFIAVLTLLCLMVLTLRL